MTWFAAAIALRRGELEDAEERALKEAQAILRRLRTRDLYRFVNEARNRNRNRNRYA